MMTQKEPVVRLLADLVAIPSMNPMGQNVPPDRYSESGVASYLREYLKRRGIDAESYEVSPGRPNVVAFIDVKASETLLLEAHMDTVHAEGMAIDPFDPVVKDGRLYGRGSCDTKGSIAAFIGSVTELLRRGSKFKYNVLLLFVADEEYRFMGAQAAVRGGLRADFGIVGEPTSLAIVRAHKGVTRWRIRTEGVAAHSAFPERGRNAVYIMGEVIRRLETYAEELARSKSDPDLGQPTISIGVIQGGSAVNVVPDSCWIEIDRRTLPGEQIEEILGAAAAKLGDLPHVRMDPPYLSVQGMSVAEDDAVVRMLSNALARGGTNAVNTVAPYATDAGIYNAEGIKTVVFGPGDIAQAHTAAEFIELDQVKKAVDVLKCLMAA
ncbi:MAG: acetylornithine deacetylase [Bacteroidia bacterium]|nr:MAG: acetylornithine deacetylase [Bacteroidia bacterium]